MIDTKLNVQQIIILNVILLFFFQNLIYRMQKTLIMSWFKIIIVYLSSNTVYTLDIDPFTNTS